MLEILLLEAGLVDEQRLPKGEEARAFLEASRQEALVRLVGTWISSRRFNELHLLPGVVSEGEWKNDPQLTRKLILSFLSRIPGGSQAIGVAGRPWWSLQAFVTAVRLHQPDFQRQAGEYETWFLKSKKSGEALTGFEHWDQVEGALLRFMIGGPLHWLGILDLALPGEALDAQLKRAWIVDSYLCSAETERGRVAAEATRECSNRFLKPQLQKLAGRPVIAFGGKAHSRVTSCLTRNNMQAKVIKAFALAPPGCYRKQALPSWKLAAEQSLGVR